MSHLPPPPGGPIPMLDNPHCPLYFTPPIPSFKFHYSIKLAHHLAPIVYRLIVTSSCKSAGLIRFCSRSVSQSRPVNRVLPSVHSSWLVDDTDINPHFVDLYVSGTGHNAPKRNQSSRWAPFSAPHTAPWERGWFSVSRSFRTFCCIWISCGWVRPSHLSSSS